jgi:hypothetical protein
MFNINKIKRNIKIFSKLAEEFKLGLKFSKMGTKNKKLFYCNKERRNGMIR